MYYRASAARIAADLGLVGWVRNCDDGSVELEAEGAKADLESLIRWCHKGPPAARVDDVVTDWQPGSGVDTRFTVRH